MEAPRVLVVTNMYPSESRPYAGIFVQRQVSDLRRAGVPIEVVVIGGERGRGDYIAARARVRHAVRHFRPAIIHCHYGYTPLAAVRLGVPYLVTLCGDDINGAWNGARGSTLKSRAGVLVTQWLARGARMVIVKSCAMQQRLWPAARRRSVLVPNGVDTTVFTPGPRLDPRRRFQVDGPGVVLGFVHSIRQRTKRLNLATEVRDELQRRGEQARLLVADRVPPGDMPWFYRACDCLLLTSEREGAPNCVKEALACGVPVVGVPVGDLPELITNPAMGAVAEADPRALADAVMQVLAVPRSGASLLPASASAGAVAERLVALYRECVTLSADA